MPMTLGVGKIRDFGRRLGVGGNSRASKKSESDLPLDHQLTYKPEPDEKWTFRDNRIINDEVDVRELVGESGNDVAVLCGVYQGLCEYQQHVWKKGGKGFAQFNGIVSSLQDTIAGRLTSLYEDMTGGVRFECSGQDFWVNNVNVCSVVALYRIRPTEKARCYLLGIKEKLGLILARQQSSTRYDGIRGRARELLVEIESALEYVPADAPLRLGDGRRIA